jgi:biotin operon repressor
MRQIELEYAAPLQSHIMKVVSQKPSTQTKIAEELGTSLPSVNRAVKALQQQGRLIISGRGGVYRYAKTELRRSISN